METKGALPQRRPRRRGRTLCIILTSVITVLIVALAVGLGVGLTRRQNNNSSNNNDAGSSGSSSSMGNITSITPHQELWQPPVNATWQIVLSSPLTLDLNANTVTPDVDVFDIDMFSNTNATFDHLHKLGKHVICYFSAGSYEPNRPDSGNFAAADKGKELQGWPGEYWLDLNSQNVRNIMSNRIKYAAYMGCDAIDPDNVDGYNNENGLGLTAQDSINFVQFLSDTAMQYNISTGLKNAADIIPDVINATAFNVNEQCVQYDECSDFNGYIHANKPVFHIEYPKGTSTNTHTDLAISTVDNICSTAGSAAGSYDFSTVVKNINLDGWSQYCNGQTAVTPCSSNNNGPTSYS